MKQVWDYIYKKNQIYLSKSRLKAERRQLSRCQTRLLFNHSRDSAPALGLIELKAASLCSSSPAGINTSRITFKCPGLITRHLHLEIVNC